MSAGNSQEALSPEQIDALFLNAQSFFASAQLNLAHVVEMTNRPTLIAPMIVLLAFSAELAMKALIALEDPSAKFTGRQGHDLQQLLGRLPEGDQRSIRDAPCRSQPPFHLARKPSEVDECLDRDNLAFQHWRYSHEAAPQGTDFAVLAIIARHCLDLYAVRRPGARVFPLQWPSRVPADW